MIQETQFTKNQFHSLKINYQTMHQELQQLDTDLSRLETRLNSLEVFSESQQVSISHGQQITPKTESKKKRRTADLVERGFPCPYTKCQKMYGTEISLNLHIRLKHNGGSKIEREEIAVHIAFKKQQKILIAQFKEEEPPQHNLNLPPNFLHQFCQNYQEFIRNLESIHKKKIIL